MLCLSEGKCGSIQVQHGMGANGASVLQHAQVDQLLAVQFQEDMNRLVQHCGRRAQGGRQTLLVSATLTPKVLLLCAVAAVLMCRAFAVQPLHHGRNRPC